MHAKSMMGLLKGLDLKWRKMLECKKERINVKHIFAHFCRFSAVFALFCGAASAYADQAPNPRSAAIMNNASARSDSRVVKRGDGANSGVVTNRARVASRRSDSATVTRAATPVVARDAGSAMIRDVNNSRNAVSVARGAVPGMTANPRGGLQVATGAARAASRSRAATAVFSDISKIGGGYSQCRDAYATCMDQFCANANDTYRRCFCSSRFTGFRDTEVALDEAKVLLQRFEDTHLNAVDKTAAEVDAMYSATIGEAAIKSDTSGAQKVLNEIGDLLSGKKTVASVAPASTSLGVMSLDFSTDIGDVWGGGDVFSGGGSSLFDFGGGAVDMTKLEGQSLYNESNKQCIPLIADSCESQAVLNMATSAYNIMITQDCNLYEKSLDKKREQVQQTVRQAEKILREARLEEYRAHNSQDVNECLDRVRTAMTQPMACGTKWERCLDYTGVYINQQTGEPIYSPRLFQLVEVINLDGAPSGNDGYTDVLTNNSQFDAFLESKKMFARQALDTCRDLSDVVWGEFKRSALIEIAQAQDEKIEEVKMSCVSTMTQCYDTQTGALQDFDTTTAQVSGAMSAYAAKLMCADKVAACASLYGNGIECKFDEAGRLTNGTACGATALIALVDTVDNVRVAEGCASAIDSYLTELCTPTGESAKTYKYPWNCRKYDLGTFGEGSTVARADVNRFSALLDSVTIETTVGNDLAKMVAKYAIQYCGNPTETTKTDSTYTYADLPIQTRTQVERKLNEINDELDYQLAELCESLDGYWIDPSSEDYKSLTAFYKTVYGGNEEYTGFGRCVENTTRVRCLAYNTDNAKEGEDGEVVPQLASYDLAKDECTFSEDWFKTQCALLGNGYFENGVCYVIGD